LDNPELSSISGEGLHPEVEKALLRVRDHAMADPTNRARRALFDLIYHAMAKSIHYHPDEVTRMLKDTKKEADLFIGVLMFK
jgi:hypothetical protein